MTPPDHSLDALLRASAPPPLAEADFLARTLAAVERVEIARTLAAVRRRQAQQLRLRRWGAAGVLAGLLMLVMAVLAAPADTRATTTIGLDLLPLWIALMAGASWLAWQELFAA